MINHLTNNPIQLIIEKLIFNDFRFSKINFNICQTSMVETKVVFNENDIGHAKITHKHRQSFKPILMM